MKIFTLTLLLCVGLTNYIFSAPPNNQDCANAIAVCQNNYSTNSSYIGQGNVANEINASTSCLGTGETNDVWYIITVTGSGNLNFSIRPKNYVNIFGVIFCDDYDWAVYNLTNAQCSDIYTNPALEVSCNFSATQDITGTRNSGTLNTQDAFGNTWNKSIPVLAGQTYMLNVSNFSGSQSGYDLSFAGSTASIVDNTKPSVLSITPQCNSTVNIKFSENVLCSTVQGSDFTITGPGGPYTAAITTSSCLTGSTYENDFGLTISPPFSQNGTYTVALTGTVTDNCGNISNLGSNSITINNSLYLGRDTTLCSGQNITLNATTTGATSYLWSTGASSPTINVSTSNTYWVRVIANGCTLRDTIVVTVNPTNAISVGIVASNINICNGANVVFTATPTQATGISPSYQWYVGANPVGTNSSVLNIATLSNGDIVKVVMSSSAACITSSPATSNTITMVVNQPTMSNINLVICQGQSVTIGGTVFTTPQINRIITLANANSRGCDSVITLNLTVNQPTTSSITQTICQGQSVTIGGTVFTTPQTNRIITLANANSRGCDSVITLNLTVNQPTTSSITQTICQGQSLIVGGTVFTTPQTNRIITLANANSKGCDSVITLNLTVNQPTTSSITQTICQGQSVTVGGTVFTTTQINRIITLTNANSIGCDSVITLNLTVNQPTTSSITQTICQGQSVTVGGTVFTTPQINRIITLANANSRGCDSVITLNLTVNQPTTSSITQAICQGQSVTVGGTVFTTTQVNRIITLTNANSRGCDSVITLNLIVNQPTTSSITQAICQGQSVTVGGTVFTTTQINRIITLANANSRGCDSVINLNLTVNQPTTSSITQAICQGQSVTVGGTVFTTTQTNRIITLANANSRGCDSVITLNLTVNQPTTSSITQAICQGQSVTVGGTVFTTPQINRIITLANANSRGCDSVITLNLTVNQPTTSSITQAICQGQSVTVGGTVFTTTQINRIITLANANSRGCDSVITLNLTVNQPTTSSITQAICQGQSVTVGGTVFTTPQINRIITLANANSRGCDSVITLNLTVNQPTTSSITQAICQGQSVTVGGTVFTTTQTNRIITLANANSRGCDSVITLNLTVNQPSTSSVTQTICLGQSVTVGGTVFTTPQTNRIITLANANSRGCDSIITLNLAVNNVINSTITQTICQGQSVSVGGTVFTTPQTNTIITLPNGSSQGCDSVITLNLTVNQPSTSSVTQTICQGQSVTVGGTVFTTTQTNRIITLANANSRGCDSVITLNLTVNQPSTSSVTQTICQGQSVTVGGTVFTTTQTNRIITLANANSRGCDSVITLNLTVNQPTTSSVTQTICQGQSVTVGGTVFTTPQTNTIITLPNGSSQGCDSVITLNLTVNQPSTSSVTQTICQGQSVTVGGTIFTTTQTNTIITLPNGSSQGCDSVITLNLTVNQPTTSSVTQTICRGQSVTVGGTIFTTTQTNRIITLANANSKGCDSVITLNLTVNQPTTSSITQTICQGQSVTVGGTVFTTTQTNRIITLANANSKGCDSVITLNLTVNQPTTSSVTQTICQGQSITVGGTVFTTTQTNKIITLVNANSKGCDSVITLNLIIHTPLLPTVSIVSNKNDICPNDVMIFTATTTNAGVTPSYQWYVNNLPVGTNSNQYSTSTLKNDDLVKVVLTTNIPCLNSNTTSSNSINAIVNKISYTKPTVEYCKNDNFQVDFDNMPIATTPNPNFIISWTNGTQITTDSTSQFTIDNSTSTNIPFSIRYGNNCRVNDVLVVKVNPLPQIDAVVNKPRVKYEETVQLDVVTSSILTNYNWIPVNKVSDANIVNPTSQITASILFTVNVKDNKNCVNIDSVFVELIDECTDDFIYVPSAFSPNGDGLNDCFSILSPPSLTNFRMTIFDRWGEKVFETNNEKDCWNGTYKGADAQSDSYPYVITYKCYNGTNLSKNGTISIIR